MKKLFKRTVVYSYCRGWIGGFTVARMFARFDLWGA
jgi:hypothetical protein